MAFHHSGRRDLGQRISVPTPSRVAPSGVRLRRRHDDWHFLGARSTTRLTRIASLHRWAHKPTAARPCRRRTVQDRQQHCRSATLKLTKNPAYWAEARVTCVPRPPLTFCLRLAPPETADISALQSGEDQVITGPLDPSIRRLRARVLPPAAHLTGYFGRSPLS